MEKTAYFSGCYRENSAHFQMTKGRQTKLLRITRKAQAPLFLCHPAPFPCYPAPFPCHPAPFSAILRFFPRHPDSLSPCHPERSEGSSSPNSPDPGKKDPSSASPPQDDMGKLCAPPNDKRETKPLRITRKVEAPLFLCHPAPFPAILRFFLPSSCDSFPLSSWFSFLCHPERSEGSSSPNSPDPEKKILRRLRLLRMTQRETASSSG